MSEAPPRRAGRLASAELAIVLVAAACLFVSIPWAGGGLGLSSDTLNHHIYLGWVADAPRFDQDFLAASYQSYQYPYSYWPLYRLSAAGVSGLTAGMVLAVLQLLVVPPVWLIARACMPGASAFDVAMRLLATALAVMSGVILLSLGTTANDLVAAVPLAWALAFAVAPFDADRANWLTPARALWASGALAGVATALKLSNGPLVVLLPLLWAASATTTKARVLAILAGGAAAAAAFLVLYAPWGLQLWRLFGNPVYPSYDDLFAPLREWLEWTP
ncbi:hypothetical protein JI739_12710 [Ramlibacter sp. AW1]|uniref:DUF2029 domain-containing protein n=1 Tax=Ramlibacter aurantiacus TaxID=2801330 RepID=A0A936ZHW7_9BURK|nr:hypothetical protein [Ramlibacter aurantiacus]MBL0421212.1 hypothetical protein [Ramlibacter aurantiacus]